jgi:hypothetical protein
MPLRSRVLGLTAWLRRVLGAAPSAPAPRRNKGLWSIGLFTGPSPLALGADPGIPCPVIAREDVRDVPASFVADPFLIQHDSRWHLFFEVLNRRSGRGEIGLATSVDLVAWRYERIVLAEPFHLSYPQVLEWEGEIYMVPESHEARSIRLYRADPFPSEWKLAHVLLEGRAFSDATLFRHGGRWWLFTETSEPRRHDTLRLYHADDLFGAWSEHPASPIVEGDPLTARPAGSVVATESGLLRFAQACAPRYGVSVNAFEITTLTPATYAERPVTTNPVLGGSGVPETWNASRMHHVDAHLVGPGRWIAAVDGALDVTAAEIDGALRAR